MTDARPLIEQEPPADPRRADDPARAPWGVVDIVAALLLTGLALAIMTIAELALLKLFNVPSDNPQGDPVGAVILLLSQVVLDVCAVAAAVLVSIRKYRASWRAWGLRPRRLFRPGLAAATLVGCFVALAAYTAMVKALDLSSLEPENNVPEALFDKAAVLPFTLLLVLVVAPITEEMFFRGFIFHGLRRRLGVAGAAVASGALFAAIHVSGAALIGLFIPFTMIGFLLAMLVARTGSLWNSIAVHAAFNSVGAAGTLGGGAGVLIDIVLVAVVFFALAWLPQNPIPPASSDEGPP